MRARHFALFATFGLLALSAPARADVRRFTFTIDGTQEVPRTLSPALGAGDVTLDTDANALSFSISYAGLLGDRTAGHFHDAPPGVNGPIEFGAAGAGPRLDELRGSLVLNDRQEAADFLAGRFYVNIHSTIFPGGEIRGQVVPKPASLSLLGLGALALLFRRPHRLPSGLAMQS